METSLDTVASELVRGEEVARKLLAHIDSGCSLETCRSLVLEMLSFFDKTILMVKSSAGTESPGTLTESSGPVFEVRQRSEMLKKRKTVPKWTSRTRLGTGPGAEGPVDDGYSWRKYGQKEILGAKHPRGYYRCTHRKSRDCLAMKQVQRSDDNPLVFDVTYRGTHTCERKSTAKVELHHQNQNMLSGFQTGREVKTEELGLNSQEEPSPSSLPFSFPSTPVNSVTTENATFSNAFISPTNSESNYFSCFGESDFSTDAATSASSFDILDMGFLLDSVDFDLDFPFDTCSFLPQNL